MGGGSPSPSLTTTTTTTTISITRLKRENFQHTKHDKAFSKWRLLIGPSDWADYEAQKEGAERYRVNNLPSVCGPGLYEIGVVDNVGRGRVVGPDRVVVVYLGQADNVRCRLQEYGRSGSHLVNGFGLFQDVFSRGYSILYRWAPMKSKSDAEKTEAQLLEKFDYAWNKLGNGARRPNDVLTKIENISSRNSKVSMIVKMLQSLREQKVGIPIKAEKLCLDRKPDHVTSEENFNLLDRVFKFSRSRPRLVPANLELTFKEVDQTQVCGVISNDGSTCSNPPVKGRKRCSKHKGRRVTSVVINTKSMTQDLSIDKFQEENFQSVTITDNVVNEKFPSICGVVLLNGSKCTKPPFPGRNRCEEHKGMRINLSISRSSDIKSVMEQPSSDHAFLGYCGVHLGDGRCCEREPVKGRKRCEQHKGMRVGAQTFKL